MITHTSYIYENPYIILTTGDFTQNCVTFMTFINRSCNLLYIDNYHCHDEPLRPRQFQRDRLTYVVCGLFSRLVIHSNI
jgi:hypothetical protein